MLAEQGVNMDTLESIERELVSLGYNSELEGDVLTVDIFGVENTSFPVILTIGEEGDLQINCRVAQFGQIGEDSLAQTITAALIQNTIIAPFAYAVITDLDQDGQDEDASEWLLVLTTAVPLSDFSSNELNYYMERLVDALIDSREVLQHVG